MTSVRSVLERAKATGDYGEVMQAIPYAQFLGLTLEERDGEFVTRMRFDPKLIGNPSVPALHGGTTGSLLESAAIFQLWIEAESVILPKTVSITIDYLRPAKPADVFAKAIVTRQGRRVANVRAEAWQDDPSKPVATGTALFLLSS